MPSPDVERGAAAPPRGTIVGDVFDTASFAALYAAMREQPRISSVPRFGPKEWSRLLGGRGYPAVLEPDRSSIADPSNILTQLQQMAGDEVVSVRRGDYGQPDEYAFRRSYQQMTLNEYLEDLVLGSGHRPGYAANHELLRATAEALGAHAPTWLLGNSLTSPFMWLGPHGAVTPLHKDSSDNVAFHMIGAKRWVLFPVRDVPALLMRRTVDIPGYSDFAVSSLDLRQLDVDRVAVEFDAHGVVVVVRAGEALYVPRGWAHYVETLETSLMINYWLDLSGVSPPELHR